MVPAKDRIIIPITMNGELRGWTARLIGTPADKSISKYYHMPGLKKSELLYNFDRARQSPYVVVCEGPSDVWAWAPNPSPSLASIPRRPSASLLATHWGTGAIVVLLDGDAENEARELCHALGSLVQRNVLVPLPAGKDPGDHTKAELDQRIQSVAREQGVDLLALANQASEPQHTTP